MQLSMRTDYALRALFTLVEHHGATPIPIIELARRNDIPKRFLEHIMLDLKEKHWVSSVAGKKGGYILARSPEKITMGEVVRHFDGYLAPIGCVSVGYPGAEDRRSPSLRRGRRGVDEVVHRGRWGGTGAH